MTIDTNDIWNLLERSQLLEKQEVLARFSEFQAAGNAENAPADVLAWLVQKKVLSQFQADLIHAGQVSALKYGGYLLVNRYEDGPLKGAFKAIHRKSNHPVLLEFLPGSSPKDLKLWKKLERLTDQVGQLGHANLAALYESVVLPQYRFVVGRCPNGSPLSKKLPRKARLPWQAACSVVSQVAAGLSELHKLKIVHGGVSPRTVWIGSGSVCELKLKTMPDPEFDSPELDDRKSETRFDYTAPEVQKNPDSESPQSDFYALGCLLYRLISGRPLFADDSIDERMRKHQSLSPPELTKYELPKKLQDLINRLLAKKPEQRPENILVVAEKLGKLAGDKRVTSEPRRSKTHYDFRNSISQWNPHVGATTTEVGTPEVEAVPDQVQSNLSPAERIEAAKQAARKRKRSKLMMPISVGVALLAISGGLAYWMLNTTIDRPVVNQRTDVNDKAPDDSPKKTDDVEDNGDSEPIDIGQKTLVQNVVADDGQRLWSSPTDGHPIDFKYLPQTPKLLYTIRPSELVASDEGQRLIKAMGPQFQVSLNAWLSQSGLDLNAIEQVVISLHSGDNLNYDVYSLVKLKTPVATERLLQLWNGPTKEQLNDQQSVYNADGHSYYPIPNSDSETDTLEFAFGPKSLIEEVVTTRGLVVFSGAMKNLAAWTDHQRHFTVIYLRPALFNDEGQWLMSGQLAQLNRQLGILLPDELRGGLFSLHLDEDFYLEMMFDRAADISALELKETLERELGDEFNRATDYLATINASSYWRKVHVRYVGMLGKAYQNLRLGIERGKVVGNCWLPPMAAHNLVAATELVTAFASGTPTADVSSPRKTPQTLEELLASPRSMSVSNPPDLGVLLSNIAAEVNDEFVNLPFEFSIQLQGNDLGKDGITQNQRPTDFELNDTTLGGILTEIMVRANPDKNISGAKDPNCKLIWVIQEDPAQPGRKVIFITTRAAAAAKSYALPPDFQTE